MYEPTGTDVAAITMCILLAPVAVEAKSASDVMFFGFPWAMMTQSLFVVKFVSKLLYTRFELFKVFVHLMSADMKTSHGEPAAICCSRALDDPELTTKLQLYCFSKAAVMLATA